jgi:hypothetical protein
VVDWKKVQTEMGPPVDHRISQEEVHDLLAGSGFEVVNETEFAGCHYGLVAVKK